MSTEKAISISRPIPLWRNRDYLLLVSGQTISLVGTQVSQLAFPLLILALTGSPAQAGLAGALRALPYLIFSLPAGALADRMDRKRVMILCDVGRVLSMASIPIAFAVGHLTLVQLYVVSLIEGTLFVFFNIAEVACLPNVVAKEQLSDAASQNLVIQNMGILLGPLFGGALYSLGRLIPFLTDTVSYIVSVLSLFFIKTNFQEKRVIPSGKLWSEMREGLAWLWHNPLIRFMAIILGGFYFIIIGAPLLIIVLAQNLHASSFTIGLMVAISGLGGVAGALVAPFVQKRFRFGPIVISMFWLMALLWLLYALAFNLVILGILTAIIFTVSSIFEVVQFSYRLALIPDALQGRVNSIFRLIAFGGMPLGFALTGVLLQTIGSTRTVLAFGACFLVLAVALALNPSVRNAPPLSEVR